MTRIRTQYMTEMEMGGILFCFLCSFLTGNLYQLCGGHLIGVLFGAVNNSPWERAKTLLLPYLVWGLLELLSIQPSMKRYTVAKTVSLWLLLGMLCGGGLLLRLCGFSADSVPFTALSLFSMLTASAAALLLYRSPLPLRNWFAVCVFLLFLFLSLYFSFTPFPPQNLLFQDSDTGLFGIVPIYYDKGASFLDAIAQINS